MRKVVALDISEVEFGDLSFQVLRGHFATTQEVVLEDCAGFSEAMVVEVLPSCPALRALFTYEVMVTERTSALDLPEIVALIAAHLNKHDLTQCVCVCSAWHAAFLSFRWASVKVFHGTTQEFFNAILQHHHLIKSLAFYDGNNPYLSTLSLTTFPSLKSLRLHSTRAKHHQEAILTLLLAPSSTLTHIRFDDVDLSQGIWKRLSERAEPLQLKKLELLRSAVMYDINDIQGFYTICSHTKILRLRQNQLPKECFNPSFAVSTDASKNINISAALESFKGVQELDLFHGYGASPMDQLLLISQCTGLKRLGWRLLDSLVEQYTEALHKFASLAVAGTWPELTSLRLSWCRLSDEVMASILGSVHRLEVLEVHGMIFGERSFEVLRSHFGTLQKLKLGCTGTGMGTMMAEILGSCPGLQELCVGNMRAKELVKSSQGHPWICALSLRKLEMYIDCGLSDSSEEIHSPTESISPIAATSPVTTGSDPTLLMARLNFDTAEDGEGWEEREEHQSPQDALMYQVFERLSHLTSLESLSIGYKWGPASYGLCPLDLKLSKGLGQLWTLKRIKCLEFVHAVQDMDEGDVAWMIENWKSLGRVHGVLNSDYETNGALRDILGHNRTRPASDRYVEKDSD
ncbi:hypothetical protein BG011_000034 [Mortierella polycephala]|uniref:F-box domain-containing protein n=1 Tax=Mortierella polycephala TaxID=41804 RepID=A0A9P6QI86_9FUNG|nr:hypothetical protein BG011_000034 [Mortierella polycephala]